MENKINIAELLKDCPSGMELDCTMFDNVTFLKIDESNIYLLREDGEVVWLTQYGQYINEKFAKCVIFPKGKTTWVGFVPPCKFKDGDVVATNNGDWIGITTGGKINTFIPTYCVIINSDKFEAYLDEKETWQFHRSATEEEKQKLFQAIKDNGYKWNAETKTLEKLVEPRFKVGNTIQDENGYKVKITEVNIEDECYGYESIIAKRIGGIAFSEQDNWKLVPNKFDINTLIPFGSRVLVRCSMDGIWKPAVFGFRNGYNNNAFYIVGGSCWSQCIPYLNNEHLCGTTNDCDEFYKTW